MQKMSRVSPQKTAVKQLKETDVNKLVPIYLEAFSGMRDPKLVKQWFRSNLRAFPQKMCFGIWLDDSLLGYIIWAEKGTFRIDAVWELEQIAVTSKLWNKGIGTKLIQDSLSEIKAHLKKRGAELKLIKVTTGVNNKSTKLYEEVLGAKKESVISDFYNGDEQIMIARTNPANTNLSEDDKALLRLEYQECQAGYNNRDKMIPDEVRNVVILFSALTAALIFGINLTGEYTGWFWTLIIVLGIFGFLSLLGFLIDIEANLSCKKALRERSKKIEDLLSSKKHPSNSNIPLCIWRNVIPERGKYKSWEEKKLQKLLSKGLPEGENNYFIWGIRFSILLWIALVVLSAIYGPQVMSAG